MNITERKCCVCQLTKCISNFGKDKSQSHGYQHQCKPCKAKIKLADRRSINGLPAQMVQDQRKRSKKKGFPAPDYTLAEFREWILSQQLYHELHSEWSNVGYPTNLRPSIDRIDDNEPYRFDNIRVTTWQENNMHGRYPANKS